MRLFNKQRTDGITYDGQGEERVGFIDNVFYNLEKGLLLKRHPYDNLSTNAKVTVQEGQECSARRACSPTCLPPVRTPSARTTYRSCDGSCRYRSATRVPSRPHCS